MTKGQLMSGKPKPALQGQPWAPNLELHYSSNRASTLVRMGVYPDDMS